MTAVRSQVIAQKAFAAVQNRCQGNEAEDKSSQKKYRSFALAFPTLIHTSGLAQATAFARAKGNEQGQVLDDLASVLRIQGENPGHQLHENAIGSGEESLVGYMALTRQALIAATWIKRYAEALIEAEG